MQELSLNILDIAENSVKAGAALVTVGVCYRPAQDRLTVTIADDGCEITVALSGDQAEESTNYHILLPLEKNNLTDPANITVIYNSDTTG